MSVRTSAWNNSAPTGRIFHEIWYLRIFRKSVETIQVSLKPVKNKDTLHEDRYTFLILSCSFRLRMRNVPDKSCRENQNTHFVFNNPSEYRAVYETMLKNTVEPGRPQMKIWCIRIACCISKATDKHSEYVKLLAFPRQQWSSERALLLCYTYISGLVYI